MNFITDRKVLISASAGLAGIIILILASSKYGAGITHDSAAYLFAAESFMKGKGFVYFGYNTPFVQWPPLFPLLIAFFGNLGFDIIHVGCYINSAVFGLITFFSSMWLFKNIKNHVFAFFGVLAVLTSVPLFDVSGYIWSEPLFILMLVLFTFAFEKYLLERNLKYLVVSAVFASLSCITRYAGITVVFTVLLFLFVQNQKLRGKIVHAVVFGGISCFPLGIWVLRNYMVFSTFTGGRAPSTVSIFNNVALTAATFTSWVIPFSQSHVLPITILVAVVILFAIVIIIKEAGEYSSAQNQVFEGTNENNLITVFMLVFAVVYTAYLIITASLIAFDSIGNRLLAPVFVPLVLLLFHRLDQFYEWTYKKPSSKYLRYVLFVFILVCLINPVQYAFQKTVTSINYGAGGYSSDRWRSSELMNYIDSIPVGCQIYSNYPDAVYVIKGRTALYPPKASGNIYEYGIERFVKEVKDSECSYIVWYNDNSRKWFYNIEELGQYFQIDKEVEVDDGAIYSIKQLE